jgi:membrane associated rhomboid family serine protease
MTAQRRLTIVVSAVLVIGFGLELRRGAAGDEVALLALGALPDSGALHGEYWRLFTYSLLHLTPLHLASNLAALLWVGGIVERRLSRTSFVLTYVGAVLAGGLAILMMHFRHPDPGSSIGASAGIFGLMTAALVLMHRPDAVEMFGADRGVEVALWSIVAAGLAMSALPGVSMAGHLGGAFAGAAGGTVGRLNGRWSLVAGR